MFFYCLQTDNCTYEHIPDQISGIYLGWAKFEVHGFSKVVISTGWDFSQQTVERVMVGTSCFDVWLFSCGMPVVQRIHYSFKYLFLAGDL